MSTAPEITADEIPLGNGPAPAPSFDSLDNAPPASVETPAAPTVTPAGNPYAGQTDKLGREFNPAKFRLKDGKPQIDSAGRFVPADLGRKPRADAAPNAPASVIPPDAPAAEKLSAASEMTAEVALGLVQTALIMVGEDEGILSEAEKIMLRGPLVRIIKKYGIGDEMACELEFAAALAVVIMARLKKPKTQTWFQSKMMQVRGWWIGRKIAKETAP